MAPEKHLVARHQNEFLWMFSGRNPTALAGGKIAGPKISNHLRRTEGSRARAHASCRRRFACHQLLAMGRNPVRE